MAANTPRRLSRLLRTILETHSIRFSLGLIASLLLAIGLARLPLYGPPAEVGWGPPTSNERIQLSDFKLETDAEEAQQEEQVSAPDVPVTIQAERRDEPAPPPDPQPEEEPTLAAESDSEDGASQRMDSPVQLTALGPSGQRPQIIGGRGSFYLQIAYPEEARRQGIQGRVILDFIVDTDGQTRNIRVVKSLHPLCDSSAVAALERTRFVPGRHNGQKVPVRMRLPVRFRLLNYTATNRESDSQKHRPDSQ